jgi:hypothetical protein
MYSSCFYVYVVVYIRGLIKYNTGHILNTFSLDNFKEMLERYDKRINKKRVNKMIIVTHHIVNL